LVIIIIIYAHLLRESVSWSYNYNNLSTTLVYTVENLGFVAWRGKENFTGPSAARFTNLVELNLLISVQGAPNLDRGARVRPSHPHAYL